MSLRTVADETPRLWRSTNVLEPIGSLVATKSATMARNTSKRRSSALAIGSHLLDRVHFTVWTGANRHERRLAPTAATITTSLSSMHSSGLGVDPRTSKKRRR